MAKGVIAVTTFVCIIALLANIDNTQTPQFRQAAPTTDHDACTTPCASSQKLACAEAQELAGETSRSWSWLPGLLLPLLRTSKPSGTFLGMRMASATVCSGGVTSGSFCVDKVVSGGYNSYYSAYLCPVVAGQSCTTPQMSRSSQQGTMWGSCTSGQVYQGLSGNAITVVSIAGPTSEVVCGQPGIYTATVSIDCTATNQPSTVSLFYANGTDLLRVPGGSITWRVAPGQSGNGPFACGNSGSDSTTVTVQFSVPDDHTTTEPMALRVQVNNLGTAACPLVQGFITVDDIADVIFVPDLQPPVPVTGDSAVNSGASPPTVTLPCTSANDYSAGLGAAFAPTDSNVFGNSASIGTTYSTADYATVTATVGAYNPWGMANSVCTRSAPLTVVATDVCGRTRVMSPSPLLIMTDSGAGLAVASSTVNVNSLYAGVLSGLTDVVLPNSLVGGSNANVATLAPLVSFTVSSNCLGTIPYTITGTPRNNILSCIECSSDSCAPSDLTVSPNTLGNPQNSISLAANSTMCAVSPSPLSVNLWIVDDSPVSWGYANPNVVIPASVNVLTDGSGMVNVACDKTVNDNYSSLIGALFAPNDYANLLKYEPTLVTPNTGPLAACQPYTGVVRVPTSCPDGTPSAQSFPVTVYDQTDPTITITSTGSNSCLIAGQGCKIPTPQLLISGLNGTNLTQALLAEYFNVAAADQCSASPTITGMNITQSDLFYGNVSAANCGVYNAAENAGLTPGTISIGVSDGCNYLTQMYVWYNVQPAGAVPYLDVNRTYAAANSINVDRSTVSVPCTSLLNFPPVSYYNEIGPLLWVPPPGYNISFSPSSAYSPGSSARLFAFNTTPVVGRSCNYQAQLNITLTSNANSTNTYTYSYTVSAQDCVAPTSLELPIVVAAAGNPSPPLWGKVANLPGTAALNPQLVAGTFPALAVRYTVASTFTPANFTSFFRFPVMDACVSSNARPSVSDITLQPPACYSYSNSGFSLLNPQPWVYRTLDILPSDGCNSLQPQPVPVYQLDDRPFSAGFANATITANAASVLSSTDANQTVRLTCNLSPATRAAYAALLTNVSLYTPTPAPPAGSTGWSNASVTVAYPLEATLFAAANVTYTPTSFGLGLRPAQGTYVLPSPTILDACTLGTNYVVQVTPPCSNQNAVFPAINVQLQDTDVPTLMIGPASGLPSANYTGGLGVIPDGAGGLPALAFQQSFNLSAASLASNLTITVTDACMLPAVPFNVTKISKGAYFCGSCAAATGLCTVETATGRQPGAVEVVWSDGCHWPTASLPLYQLDERPPGALAVNMSYADAAGITAAVSADSSSSAVTLKCASSATAADYYNAIAGGLYMLPSNTDASWSLSPAAGDFTLGNQDGCSRSGTVTVMPVNYCGKAGSPTAVQVIVEDQTAPTFTITAAPKITNATACIMATDSGDALIYGDPSGANVTAATFSSFFQITATDECNPAGVTVTVTVNAASDIFLPSTNATTCALAGSDLDAGKQPGQITVTASDGCNQQSVEYLVYRTAPSGGSVVQTTLTLASNNCPANINNATWRANLGASVRADLAKVAKVPAEQVSVASITCGSIVLTSNVMFNSGAQASLATAFVATIQSQPNLLLSPSTQSQYGSVTGASSTQTSFGPPTSGGNVAPATTDNNWKLGVGLGLGLGLGLIIVGAIAMVLIRNKRQAGSVAMPGTSGLPVAPIVRTSFQGPTKRPSIKTGEAEEPASGAAARASTPRGGAELTTV